jgi:hypothetical protein
MTRLYIIARTVLTAIAIYIVFYILEAFFSAKYNMVSFQQSEQTKGAIFWLFKQFCDLINRMPLIILALLAFMFIVKGDKLAHKIVGKTPLEQDFDVKKYFVQIHTLAAVCLGIVFIFELIPTIEIIFYRMAIDVKEDQQIGNLTLGHILQWALAIYLLLGAGKFVNGLANKSLEYIQLVSEPQTNS